MAGLWNLVGKEIRAGGNDRRRGRFCPPYGTWIRRIPAHPCRLDGATL